MHENKGPGLQSTVIDSIKSYLYAIALVKAHLIYTRVHATNTNNLHEIALIKAHLIYTMVHSTNTNDMLLFKLH